MEDNLVNVYQNFKSIYYPLPLLKLIRYVYLQQNTEILAVQLCKFSRWAHSHDHHHSQDTEHFHHTKSVLMPTRNAALILTSVTTGQCRLLLHNTSNECNRTVGTVWRLTSVQQVLKTHHAAVGMYSYSFLLLHTIPFYKSTTICSADSCLHCS